MPPIGGSSDHKAAWDLVRSQEGVIARAQLLDAGFSRHAIAHRVERGRITSLWPGVYRVGQLPITRNGLFVAAVLACGPGAALSHASAAAAWGIHAQGGTGPIHVSIPATRRVRLEGIRSHRRSPMPPTTNRGSLVLSQPLFTLVDLAATAATDELEHAINEADRLGPIDFGSIEAQLDCITMYPGVAALRACIDRYTRPDSNLERCFLTLVRKARLPLPQTQESIGRGRIDFHWPELGLVARPTA
jgi:hypothetical protein